MRKHTKPTIRPAVYGSVVLDTYEQEIERAFERNGIERYPAKKREQ